MGLDSRVLTIDGLGERAQELELSGVVVTQAETPEVVADGLTGWTPDIVHLHSHGLSQRTVALLRAQWPNATLVEQNVFASPSPWMMDLTMSFQLTPWCQWRYSTRGGDVGKSAVVPYPVNTEAFSRDVRGGNRIRASLNIPSGALVLGRVGQPASNKWHPLTIDAFEGVARDREDAHCILIGASPDIQHLARTSRYVNRIHCVDSVVGDQELTAHYSAMDVFVHAAHQGETFGYVLTEAMLCEVPIVTLETPWSDNSQGYVVGNQIGGLVTSTARNFASAVRRLAVDGRLRKQLGHRARKRVIEEFDVDQVARHCLELSQGTVRQDPQQIRNYSRTSTNPILAPIRGVESWRWLASAGFNALETSRRRRGLLQPPAK